MSKSYREILDDVARQQIPDDLDLSSRITAKVQKVKSPMKTRRILALAVLVILLISVLILVNVPVVAQAVHDLFGFLPGVGVVQESASLRVLAKPVSQTRSGITLTVTQALLAADKTVLLFEIKNIPPADVIQGAASSQNCFAQLALRLPNGTMLPAQDGYSDGTGTGFEGRFNFGSIPAKVKRAILMLPCIENTLPGTTPEKWELSLNFIAAPPDMTLASVVDVATPTGNVRPALMTVDQVIDTATGYILIGKFHSIHLPYNAIAIGIPDGVKITDAAGQEIPATIPQELPPITASSGEISWGYEIQGKQFTWPLTITFPTVEVTIPGVESEFRFDTGPNPRVGQVWTLNQEVMIAGYSMTVTTIQERASGYTFNFHTPPSMETLAIDLGPFSPGGGGGSDGAGNLSIDLDYAGQLPAGVLTVRLSDPMVSLPGPWQVQWSPTAVP